MRPLFVLLGLLLSPSAAHCAEPLTLEAMIPLPRVSGRIDHMAIDLVRHRLFVAELGNGTVDVVDLERRRLAGRIAGLREPQGVGWAPRAGVLIVANGGDGSARVFGGKTLAPMGSIALGSDADNVRIDPRDDMAIIGYGSGALAVIDPGRRERIADVKLRDHPEGFQLNPGTGKIFVNVPGAGEIATVDLAAQKQTGRWPLRGYKANFPMAIDSAGKLVATVFRRPPRLLLYDTETGTPIIDLPACRDADDVFFDERRGRIYVSCGEGVVAVFAVDQRGWRPFGRLPTPPGARTALYAAARDRLYVAAPAGAPGSDARILVLRPPA